MLREEDKYDKELFRERVKQKHREERQKIKADKRSKANEHETTKSLDSDDDYEPDVSWLPDPDNLFTNVSEDDGSTKSTDEEKSCNK